MERTSCRDFESRGATTAGSWRVVGLRSGGTGRGRRSSRRPRGRRRRRAGGPRRAGRARRARPRARRRSPCRPRRAAPRAGAHLRVLLGGADHGVDPVRVGDEADLQLLGHVVEEALAGRLSRGEAARPDVRGVHRARRVRDEHDRGALDRHGDGRLGTGEREHRPRQGEAQQRRGHEAACAAPRRQHGGHGRGGREAPARAWCRDAEPCCRSRRIQGWPPSRRSPS